MNTITQTKQAPPVHLPLVLRLKSTPTRQNYLDRLLAILEKYKFGEDDLSQVLSAWGDDVCCLLLEESATLSSQLAERIHALQRKILVNPLGGAPLKSPVLVNGRVLEEWVLCHMREVMTHNPFDAQPFSHEYSFHSFALDMMSWLDEMLQSSDRKLQALNEEVKRLEESDDCTYWITEEEAKQADPVDASLQYQGWAEDEMAAEKALNEAKASRRTTAEIALTVEVLKESLDENLEGLKGNLEAIDRSHIEHVNAMRQSYEGLLARKDAVIDEQKAEISHLGTRVTRMGEQINGLSSRVSGLEIQNDRFAREIQQLRQQVANLEDDDDGCTIM